MKDPEFYTTEENWPQPPDDSCTLEPVEQAKHAEKKKTKSATSAKMKKKMSESLAGVTAAAVAVVMLSTAIPALKDSFDDFPELPGFGDNHQCPVCHMVDCPYYYDGMTGLAISLESDVEYLESDDLYSMAGFTSSGYQYADVAYPCIPMEAGDRAVLRLRKDILQSLPLAEYWESDIWFNTYTGSEAEYSYTGVLFCGVDEKNPMTQSFLYVLLVYSSTGSIPLMEPAALMEENDYIDIDLNNTKCRTLKVPDYPQLEVQFFSNMDEELLDTCISQYEVFVLTDEYQQYALGQTMLFTEEDFARRSFADYEYWGIHNDYGFHIDGEEEYHSLILDFPQKEYSLSMDYQIIFTPVGWKAVFDRWRDLNENASDLGHEVYFPVEELNNITVNGIEYTCYIVYSAAAVDDVNDYPWIWYYMVPKQEETVAIVDHRSISPEMLQKLLETLDINDAIPPEDILNQISLR